MPTSIGHRLTPAGDDAAPRQRGPARHAEVLGDGPVHEGAFSLTIARQESDAAPDGARRATHRRHLSSHFDRPGVSIANAVDRLGDLLRARPDPAVEGDDLAGAQLEVDIGERALGRQVAKPDDRVDLRCPRMLRRAAASNPPVDRPSPPPSRHGRGRPRLLRAPSRRLARPALGRQSAEPRRGDG